MKLLHQAAFASRCIVSVNNPPACRFIQVLNSSPGRFNCLGDVITLDRFTCFLNKGTSASAINAIIGTTLYILADAFDCGFMISHRQYAAEV